VPEVEVRELAEVAQGAGEVAGALLPQAVVAAARGGWGLVRGWPCSRARRDRGEENLAQVCLSAYRRQRCSRFSSLERNPVNIWIPLICSLLPLEIEIREECRAHRTRTLNFRVCCSSSVPLNLRSKCFKLCSLQHRSSFKEATPFSSGAVLLNEE
jgi:hypothetical protein